MNRVLSPILTRLYAEAERLYLDNPLGRAIYATSRHQNNAVTPARFHQANNTHCRCELCIMIKARATTAARWLAHWEAGGHLKALCYGSGEWLALRRVREAKRKDVVNRFRREDYARRKGEKR